MRYIELAKWGSCHVCAVSLLVLLSLASPAAAQSQAAVTVQPDRIETGGGIYFDNNAATLRQESFAVLDQVVAVLRDPSITLQIQVHTDSRGSGAYNLRMSQMRAAAIYQYLVQRGVSPERLSFQGYGETCPRSTNQTASGRQGNRRIVFWRTDTGLASPCPVPPPPVPPEQQ